jgi:endoglucanase
VGEGPQTAAGTPSGLAAAEPITAEPITAILHVDGDEVTEAGRPIRLRGMGVAGWLNMENWMTGFPAYELGQRDSVAAVLGPERTEFFLERFREHFFAEADAALIGELGFNVVRIPIHYRLFEDDERPFEIKEEGFRHLDRAIRLCAQNGVRTIIDLHTLPGWQNQDWHCDNPTHTAQFWRHPHFQDRVVSLWRVIAGRYRGNPAVAAYNPMNEPADPTGKVVGPFSRRLVAAIREVDPDHIVILEGNRYANEFDVLGDPLPNVIYSHHDYSPPGYVEAGRYPGHAHLTHIWESADGQSYQHGILLPGESREQYFDKSAVERSFLKRSEYMLSSGTPIFVGEFNAIFTGDPVSDSERLTLLSDQLEIFSKHRASWAFWPYKDIGVAAPVMVRPDSAWRTRIQPMTEKKARLGVDLWGGTHDQIMDVMGPLKALFAREFPDYSPFPFGSEFLINRLVPQILFAEALLPEFGELFRGMTEDGIDAMMSSFRLENCVYRQPLLDLLRDACARDR